MSASSSELTTAPLKGLGRGVVVGTRTYGKGVGQHHYPLPNGGTLAFTTMGFETPLGRYHGIGLVPTVCTAGATGALQLDTRLRAALAGIEYACLKETRTSEQDVQLARRILDDPEVYRRLAEKRTPAAPALASTR